jgi:hypothetical protein
MFPPDVAWAYAWVSIVGKFLLYMLLSIETVYYGQIMEHEKPVLPFHLVRNSLCLMWGIALLAILVNYFIGSFVLAILNPELVQYGQVYITMLVYYSFLAFISLFSKVLVGWWVYRVNFLMLILYISLFATLYFSKITQLETFAMILVWNIILGFFMIGWLFFVELTQHKKWKNTYFL